MKNKFIPFAIALTLSIVVIFALLTVTIICKPGYVPHLYKTVTMSNQSFNITALELNESQWQHGLMNSTITNSTLMLFEFNQTGDYAFWMFDTYSNLDMIWINYSYTGNSGKIVYVAKNATSCFDASKCVVYDPAKFANFVLEAKAGFSQKYNISVGNIVNLK